MKNLSLSYVIFSVSALLILLGSCQSECSQTLYYTAHVPVYMQLGDIRSSYAVMPAKEIGEIGKIAEGNGTLFLLEEDKGIHVIDNSDPQNPVKVSFLNIISCLDIEAVDNLLYVVQATDLITFDVSDLNNITKLGTNLNVFNSNFLKKDSFVVDHELQEVVQVVEQSFSCSDMFVEAPIPEGSTRDAIVSVPFTQLHAKNNMLYSCDHGTLKVFGIDGSSNANFVSSQTLFNFDQYNFITSGSRSLYVGAAVSINEFDISANPGNPPIVRFYGVSLSCNRFTALDTFLFVPGFGGPKFGFCEPSNDLSLFRINTTRLSQNTVGRFFMTAPQHVAVMDSLMVLSEGAVGMKLFDVRNPAAFNVTSRIISSIPNLHTTQSLLRKNLLISVGDDGVSQFDISNLPTIQPLSTLK